MGIGGQQKDDYFVFVHFSSRLAAAAAAAAAVVYLRVFCVFSHHRHQSDQVTLGSTWFDCSDVIRQQMILLLFIIGPLLLLCHCLFL